MTPGTENVEKMEKPNAHKNNASNSNNTNNINFMNAAEKEAIHSGHFMVSDIDDTEAQDDIDSVSVPVLEAEDTTDVVPQQPFDFENACKETSNTYTFGPCSCKSISIDATLTKLFQCMTIAYSGKLTSPRWKNFKGLKLRWKDKIRLNNVIWRAWHMQFVMRQSPVVCQFASPLDGDTHNKPEFVHPQAVVLEGKYWKRRLDTVCAEYKKWRLFYKDKQYRTNRAMSEADWEDCFSWQPRSHQSFHSPNSMIVDDDPFIDFNDTLFSCLIPNQPFAFPNPREIARGAGLADFMQPGLVQLQPNLEDFMDTWDNMFNSTKLSVVNEEPTEEPSLQALLEQTVQSHQSNQRYNSFANTLSNQTSSNNTQQYSTAGKSYDLETPTPTLTDLYSVGESEFSSMDMSSMQAMTSDDYKSQIDMSSNYKQQSSGVHTMTSSDYKCQAGGIQTMTSNDYKPETTNNLHTIRSNNYKSRSNDMAMMSSNNYKQQVCGMQPVASNDYKSQTDSMRSTSSSSYVQCTSAPMPPPPLPQNSQLGPSSPLQDVLGQATLETITQGQPQQNFVSTSQQVFGSAPQQNFNSAQQSPQHSPPQTFVPLKPLSPSSQERFIDSNSLPQGTSLLSTKMGAKKYVNIRRAPSPVPPSSSPNIISHSSSNTAQLIQSQPASTGRGHTEGPRRRETKSLTSLLGHNHTTTLPQSQGRTDNHKHDVFIMPKGTPRIRSRSMSGPQATTVGLGVSAATNSILAHTPGVPSSALLAQLLTTGTYLRPDKAPDQPSPASSPPGLALISTVNNLQSTQTVVISPITLATGTSGQILAPTSLPSVTVSTLDNTSFSTTVTSSNSPPSLMGCPPPPLNDNRASPPKPFRPKSDTERVQYREHRRVCHINAEQKRRCNIKGGFDMLHTLVPSLAQSPNSKISKAAMLHKAGEYIIQLRAERAQLQDEAELLRKQIESLNQAINVCQSQLPATGVPVSRQRASKLKDMFDEYVRKRTLQNWKFWIFSILIQPLLNSYNNCVSTASMEDLCRTVLTWLEQHCSLVALRPAVLNSLRQLSTSTNILSDPSRIADEAAQAVAKSTPRNQ